MTLKKVDFVIRTMIDQNKHKQRWDESDPKYTLKHWKRVRRLLKAMEEGRCDWGHRYPDPEYDPNKNLFGVLAVQSNEKYRWFSFNDFTIDSRKLDEKGRFVDRKKAKNKSLKEMIATAKKLQPPNYEDERPDLDSLQVGPVFGMPRVDVRDHDHVPWTEEALYLVGRAQDWLSVVNKDGVVTVWRYARYHQEQKTCPNCKQEVKGDD